MAKRKTISIEQFKNDINFAIVHHSTVVGRQALTCFAETILMNAGQYKGFNYIDWYEIGIARWEADGKPDDKTKYLGDQSKVFFY